MMNSQSFARQNRLLQRTVAMNAAVWSLGSYRTCRIRKWLSDSTKRARPVSRIRYQIVRSEPFRVGRTLPERE